MDNGVLVTDPSDWTGTAAASLAPVDSALRCQVCKEFFNTPMITSCSHTFCSLCIRRCLTNDGKCPACRSEDAPTRLRRNWVVEELVQAFTRARPSLLEIEKEVQNGVANGEGRGTKRKRADKETTGRSKTLRSSTRSQTTRAQETTVEGIEHIDLDETDPDFEDDEQLAEDKDQDDANAYGKDGTALCPICQRRMKIEAVFTHIDREHGTKPSPAAFGSLPRPPPAETPTKSVERLAHLNYSLLNDGAMRKKLDSLGIPNWGPKPLLIRRHKEWVDIFNANYDSARPRAKRELLRDLDVWERTQGGQASNGSARDNVMAKDFDGAAWATQNQTDFGKLISQAKEARAQKAAQSAAKDEPTQVAGGEPRADGRQVAGTAPTIEEG